MTIRTILWSATAGTALMLSGCGSNNSENSMGPSTTAADDSGAGMGSPDAMASSGAAGAMMPLTGQSFVETVAASDQFEMEAARIVQSAGVTGATRDFAQMMIKEHGASSADLKAAINKSENVTVQNQPVLTVEQQTMLTELRAAPKEQVAQVYARQQVAAHQQTLAVLQQYGQSGDAKPLMDFANKAAGVVTKHLDEARKLP